ncbi:MAG: hypothetical protein ABFD77_11090 [Thermotogota bacterium]
MKKNRISKAAGADNKGKTFRLTDIDPEFVSLVTAGANRQKGFQVVKSDDEAAKAVPDASASAEDKKKAQGDRATKYGIEAREDGNLSYPSDSPTTEGLYGDPVNLMYPLAGTDNKPDVARIRNALSRFSQNRDEYGENSSKVKILERVVEAALSAGVDVTAPEGDEIYDALPAALRDRISGKESDKSKGDDKTSGGKEPNTEDATDLTSWLEEAGEKVDELSLDIAVQQALDLQAADTSTPKKDSPTAAQEIDPAAASSAKSGARKSAEDERVAEDLKKAHRENVALKAKIQRLQASVGKSSVLLTGEAPRRQEEKKKHTSPSNGAFFGGRDIAAEVTKGRG